MKTNIIILKRIISLVMHHKRYIKTVKYIIYTKMVTITTASGLST